MTWAELNEARSLRKEIGKMETELSALRHLYGVKVPVKDGLPKSASIDSQVERLAIKIVDLEREISELKSKLVDEVIPRLEQRIWQEVEDGIARTIYYLRYVDGMRFREIGFTTGYSEAHVYYLHRITGEKIISDWKF